MKTAIIIVTMDKWEEYVIPYIKSIRDFEDSTIVVINNGMNRPIPAHLLDDFDNVIVGNAWKKYSPETPVSYAEAINHGLWWISEIEKSTGRFDWIVISNDDVLLEGEFSKWLRGIDINRIYGDRLHYSSKYFDNKYPWVDGWIYYLHRTVIDNVGKFDENFEAAGFEDADYCWRAVEKGYHINKINLPFRHLKKHTRKEVEDYKNKRLKNMRYLIKKHGIPGRI